MVGPGVIISSSSLSQSLPTTGGNPPSPLFPPPFPSFQPFYRLDEGGTTPRVGSGEESIEDDDEAAALRSRGRECSSFRRNGNISGIERMHSIRPGPVYSIDWAAAFCVEFCLVISGCVARTRAFPLFKRNLLIK